ncbi:right-handed parallel beta-helix repeat-containing protein [Rubinisphaera sp.]|uniref:right-handed parallel beta-helix repeat-containing protein n=1 Tax=Rubinisphaera sp. TaxID=2024857 RepID=UPI0025E537BE|nr:right-handed parallel beta-helix repeat-containing protein [Rubinisphaera sp.]
MKHLYLNYVVVLTFVILCQGTAQARDELWQPYLELEGRGTTIRSAGQGTLFAPIWQDEESLIFADIRGLGTDGDAGEGNFGVAYRKIIDTQYILGANLFYDFRHTEVNNEYHQGAFGLEFLTTDSGLRFNAYIPDQGVKYATQANAAFIQGGTVVVQQGLEAAYWGLDLEAERLLWHRTSCDNCTTNRHLGNLDMELWASIGVFHFDNDAANFRNITGPRARTELRLYDIPSLGQDSRVVLSGQYEYDEVRSDVFGAMVNLRIPIGPGGSKKTYRLQGLDRRMVAPIVRDIDIVTNTGAFGTPEMAKFSTNLLPISNVTTIDGNTVDPEGDFFAAGPNSLVLFDGSFSTITADTTFQFNDGQVALGGGSSIQVIGCDTGSIATLAAPGTRPLIDGGLNPIDLFTLAQDNTIQGLDLSGGDVGIYGDGVGGFTIDGNNISGAALGGIYLENNLGGGVVENNNSSNNDFFGIDVGGADLLSLSNNTANSNGVLGMLIDGVDGDVSGNTTNDNVEDGLVILGDVSGSLINNMALNNGLIGSSGTGIVILGDINTSGNAVGISGNIANGNYDEGIFLLGDVNGTISNNITNNNGEDGFQMFDVDILFTNNTSNGNGDDGFDFDRLLSGGQIVNNSASGNAESGFDFDDDILAGSLISGNTSNTNSEFGYDFFDMNGEFRDNLADSNILDGFNFADVGAGGIFEGNTANGNLDGFYFDENNGLFRNNVAANNTEDGFDILINNGTFTGNVANNNDELGYNSVFPNNGTATMNTGSGNTNGGNTFP